MFFNEEMLEFIFDELIAALDIEDFTFESWKSDTGYNSSMTDQEIYAILPSEFLPFLGDFGLNASWYHDGM